MSQYVALREQIATESKRLFDITRTMGPTLDAQKALDAGLVSGATTTADVVAEVKRLNASLNDLNEKFAPFKEIEDASRNAAEFQKRFNEPAPQRSVTTAGDSPIKSIGQTFIESAAYKAARDGGNWKGLSVDLPVEVKTLFQTSAGYATEAIRSGRNEFLPLRPITVVDFVPSIPIDQSADVYMEETTATEAAAERAEGAAYAEAEFAWTERTKTVRSVGVSLPTTDEQMADVPGIAGMIDNRLVLAVRRRVDLQILAGSGVSPNLEGTENVTGIQSQAKGVDNIADAIFKCLRAIEDDGFADADAIFIRASKWQDWRLAKTNDGIYLHGSPADAGPARLWGKPVITTNVPTATKAVMGAYQAYSALRTRTGLTVETGFVGDNFKEGKKTLRAGVRVAMVHYRPKAFGVVTGL